MTKKDPLFALIKSLKKTEKTYFKKFTQLHTIGEQNNYVELFDVINDMEEYNEEHILEHFKDQNLVKQLHVIKNYLYKQLLKSLRVYYASMNVDTTIRELLDNITILHQKGFPEQAAKNLIKAKKIATQHEKHEYYLILLRWEIRISSSDIYTGNKLNSAVDLMLTIEDTLSQLKNINDFYSLTVKIYEGRRTKGHVRSQEELNSLREILKTPLLNNPEMAQNFRSKIYYFYILSVINTELGNEFEAINNAKLLVKVFQTYEEELNDEPSNYGTVLNHLIETLLVFNKYQEALDYIEQLQLVNIKSAYTEMMIFYRTYMLQLDVYIKTGEFQKGIPTALQLINGLSEYEGKIADAIRTKLYFQLAHVYFGIEEYKTALQWINKLLNEREVKEDILNLAMIFSLIIHFELKNYDILDYQAKSIVRKLSNKNRLFETEKLFIELIKKIPKIIHQEKISIHFIEIQKKLQEILDDNNTILERNTLEYFNFNAWILSKIKNNTYFEQVKNSILKTN